MMAIVQVYKQDGWIFSSI